MKWLVVLAIISIVVLALAMRVRRADRRTPDGVEGFRRHMDALSSDSRRDVIDRVRGTDDDPKNGKG